MNLNVSLVRTSLLVSVAALTCCFVPRTRAQQDPAADSNPGATGLRPKREGKWGPTRHGGSSSTHSVDLRSNAATHFRLEIACARKARFSEEEIGRAHV